MTDNKLDASHWAAGVIFLILAVFIGYSLPRQRANDLAAGSGETKTLAPESPKPATTTGHQFGAVSTAGSGSAAAAFTPPPDSAISKNKFGDMVRFGEIVFRDTQHNAPSFVGNSLQCSNCHIDGGRLASSAPLWAAYVSYPAYRAKDGRVNTFAERMQGCFRFSMNGKAPPLGDKVLVALESYAYFLATGMPTAGAPKHGYVKLAPTAFDYRRGEQVYTQHCALCHGADGSGQASADGETVFPPLWGARSYNWGAGMSEINNAAAFVRANMPFGEGGTLTAQEAWDVAAYIDSQERPQDPRFQDSVLQTRKLYHNSPMSMYGMKVNGILLGEKSPRSGS